MARVRAATGYPTLAETLAEDAHLILWDYFSGESASRRSVL